MKHNAIRLHGTLQRSRANCHALLGQKVLAHHVRIAAMRNQPLAQPTFKAIGGIIRVGGTPAS
ncbi:hypothetical protein X757_21555 [Mesorhizobium sp. LSHC414A00]|nr:hypothetical protein X757_21555 [Mesorhizobium sp. LSHC414A00]